MPIYEYECPECGNLAEVFRSIDKRLSTPTCKCGTEMRKLISSGVASGDKEYGKTKWSDSLAVSPAQIEEHKRLFPDVKIDDQGRPGFDSFKQHDGYLKKTGFIKMEQKRRKRGKRIA